MDPKVLAELKAIDAKNDYSNPRYMELLMPNFYKEHLCRLAEWPDGFNRTFAHLGRMAMVEIYTMMQGPSEFGIAGRLGQLGYQRSVERNKSTNIDDRSEV